jgi:hypothetical protein
MKLKYIFLLFLAFGATTLYGQDKQLASDHLSIKFLFRLGQADLDTTYKDNAQSLKNFVANIKSVFQDKNYVVTNFRITSAASPDGKTEAFNIRLAQARAKSMIQYITSQVNLPDSIIVIDNKGENWGALRDMVESSEMPYRREVLWVLDNYPNRDIRKNKLKVMRGGVPYKYMFEHFFPDLRGGVWGTTEAQALTITNLKNWKIIRSLLVHSDLTEKEKLLNHLDSIANPEDRIRELKAYNEGKTYDYIVISSLSSLLYADDSQSIKNWNMLGTMIDASGMPDKEKEEVLHIIKNVPIAAGREGQLKALESGIPYNYMKEHFFLRLLQESSTSDSKGASATLVITEEIWKSLYQMIELSSMADKDVILHIIDQNPDPAKRVEALMAYKDGRGYQYICDVFLPSLLYNNSPTSLNTWKQMEELVAASDLSNKAQVLEILRTVPLSMGAIDKLISLDNGKIYHLIQDRLFTKLFMNQTSDIQSGAGMSLSYKLSPEAQKRKDASIQLEEWRRAYETRAVEAEAAIATKKAVADSVAAAAAGKEAVREVTRQASAQRSLVCPIVGIQSNILYWVGITSEFDHHYMTPNVSLEYFLGKRWSFNLEGIYTSIDKKDADNEIWANSDISIEPRYWLKGDQRFKGLFVGAYGLYGDFNVKLNSLSTANGYTGNYYEGGLSIGYQLQIFEGLGLELGARGGYRYTSYDIYFVRNGHHYAIERSLSKNEIGLTGIHISLNYRIGKASKKSGNENK